MTKNALKNLKFLGVFFFLIIITNTKEGKAQETVKFSERHTVQRKFTVEWGYNRSNYTNSDITFKGPNYDFTLYNAKAKDNPEKFDPKIYINPFKLTIPQFNFRVGYFFNKNWSLTLGWDHMKYILDQNQIVNINGVIDSSLSNSYDGIYSNQNISLPANFLRYEHSDGCNYVRLSFERNQKLIGLFDDRIEITGIAALGCGAMVPWTDVTWFGTRYKNWLHLAGYAVNAEAAIKTEFFKRFFFKGSIMKGYVNMNDILITGEKNQRASQHFGFTQWYLTGGMNIYFNRAKAKNS